MDIWKSLFLDTVSITVVNHIPTTTVILIIIIGIPLFMIIKVEFQKQSYRQNLPFQS